MTIKYINNIVPETYTNISGSKLFDFLKEYFENGEKVKLSFDGLTPFSTSFLNSSFGKLIDIYGLNTFKSIVSPTDVNASQAKALKEYISSFKQAA